MRFGLVPPHTERHGVRSLQTTHGRLPTLTSVLLFVLFVSFCSISAFCNSFPQGSHAVEVDTRRFMRDQPIQIFQCRRALP